MTKPHFRKSNDLCCPSTTSPFGSCNLHSRLCLSSASFFSVCSPTNPAPAAPATGRWGLSHRSVQPHARPPRRVTSSAGKTGTLGPSNPDLLVMRLTIEEEEVHARRCKISIVSSELDLIDQKTCPSQCGHWIQTARLETEWCFKTKRSPPDTFTTETVSIVHSGPLQVNDASSSTVRVCLQADVPLPEVASTRTNSFKIEQAYIQPETEIHAPRSSKNPAPHSLPNNCEVGSKFKTSKASLLHFTLFWGTDNRNLDILSSVRRSPDSCAPRTRIWLLHLFEVITAVVPT